METNAKIMEINTTIGKKWLVCTLSKSREFKTLNGAIRWCLKNGKNYEII